MNIDEIMDNLTEMMLDGEYKVEFEKFNTIPKTKIKIFKQNSSKWWMQIPTPPELGFSNNRKRLKTEIKIDGKKSFLEACRFALRTVYKNEIKKEEGLPLFELKPTVKSIALQTIKAYQEKKIQKTTYVDYIRVLEKELIPQFGDTYIQNFRRKEIFAFFHQRESKSSTRASVALTAINALLDYAVDSNAIRQGDKPKISKKELDVEISEEHESFRDSDLKLINENYQSFIDSSRNKKTKEIREIFFFYMKFLKTTGVRTGEETKILWKDIFISKAKNNRIVLKICNGKIAKSRKIKREICLDQETIENLIKLLYFQTGFNDKVKDTFKKFDIKSKVSYGETDFKHENLIEMIKLFKLEKKYIFERKDGKYPVFLESFNQLKKFLDNRLSSEKLTLYSFRHYFITDRLINEVDSFQLAKYCGTSVAMIEDYYAKVRARMSSEHMKKNLDLEVYRM